MEPVKRETVRRAVKNWGWGMGGGAKFCKVISASLKIVQHETTFSS